MADVMPKGMQRDDRINEREHSAPDGRGWVHPPGFDFLFIRGLGLTRLLLSLPPGLSSSTFTVLLRRLLLIWGLVLALAAELLVPCWDAWAIMGGAAILLW